MIEHITATANPRAIATLTGVVGLRPDTPDQPACELRDDGSCIWRLRHGLTVTVHHLDNGAARWHLDRDDFPASSRGHFASPTTGDDIPVSRKGTSG